MKYILILLLFVANLAQAQDILTLTFNTVKTEIVNVKGDTTTNQFDTDLQAYINYDSAQFITVENNIATVSKIQELYLMSEDETVFILKNKHWLLKGDKLTLFFYIHSPIGTISHKNEYFLE